MKKTEKVQYLIHTLGTLYPNPPIPLTHTTPYTLLVAVLLSAQCTDARVNTVTPILFERANTPKTMAKLPISDIEHIIKPCGLYKNKAKAISSLSHILSNEYNSVVPRDITHLEALPGVGHKTASVVVSQAFGIPAFPVDTHIHRLLWRWGLSTGKNVVQTEKDAKRLFPKDKWNVLHLQIIYYARTYSPAVGWDRDKDIIFQKIGRKSIR